MQQGPEVETGPPADRTETFLESAQPPRDSGLHSE